MPKCKHAAGTSRTRLNPDSTDRFVALRRELGVSAFGMNQIVLQPGQRGRIHRRLVLLALGGDGEHNGRDGEAFTDWRQDVGAAPQDVPLPSDLPSDEFR